MRTLPGRSLAAVLVCFLASCSADMEAPSQPAAASPRTVAPVATAGEAVASFGATVLAVAQDKPLTKEDILNRSAPALAFVLRDQTNITVTAFCVDASGLFVTHERAGQYGGDRGFRLILNAGLPTEREVKAKIIHSETTQLVQGLALVRAEGVKDLPTLSLGTVEAGTDSLELISIGFPFTVAGGNKPPFPQAKMHAGQGKPVWQLNELAGIKHDGSLRGANYGAPLLDSRGQVVGVQAPSEAAIPVTRVRQFLAEAQKKGVEVALAPSEPPRPAAAPAQGKPAVAVAPLAAGKPLSQIELARLGKAATAFVRVHGDKQISAGSGFCVHPSGLFVTNEHVVTGVKDVKKIDLVLNSGEAGQRILPAKVLRVDKDNDLALLQLEKTEKLPILALGAETDLAELMELIAFGFPFGSALAVSKGEYPSMSVNAGSVTSLRRKGGELAVLQVDITLNPGNSGGPVLDNTGRVVGVVVAGVRGTGVNFVVPVNLLRRFLAKPELQLLPPTLTRANLHEPAVFQAKALQAVALHPPLVLELIVRTPDGKEHRQRMEATGDTHRAAATIAAAPKGPTQLRLNVRYAAGSIQGTAVDQPFTVNGTPHRLRDVRRVQGSPKPQVTLLDGKTLEGALAGLDAVPLQLGAQAVPVNLGRAAEVAVEAPGAIDRVTATVVATQDGQEVDRISTVLTVEGAAPRSGVPSGGATIRPPVLEGDKVRYSLPAAVADVAVGGGGRFLILHLPQQRKLAIFDVNEAKIVESIPVTEDNVKFAAGLDKLVIVYPRETLIQRWSLTTFAREAVTTLPMKVPPVAVAMGSASHGPLCISGVDYPRLGETVFFDVQTMKRIEVPGDATNFFGTSPQVCLRASANGRLFACQAAPTGGGMQACVWTGNKAQKYEGGRGNYPIPSPDGQLICTSHGAYSAEWKEVAVTAVPTLPAHHGPYYFTLGRPRNLPSPRPDIKPPLLPPDPRSPATPLTLYMAGHPRSLAVDSQIDSLLGITLANPGPLSFDKRVHLLPDARLLIIIPPSNDSLILHRFDVDQFLEKSGADYLFVASPAPSGAVRGATYTWSLAVKSKRGGVQCRLESGPQGMTIAPDGRITWPVPADFAETEVTVILAVRDAAGQECFHTFTLGVREPK